MKYTEKDLDDLIDSKLNYHIDCKTFPNVCRILETKAGRIRVFNRVKTLIKDDNITDIDEALANIEASV
ncbi:MAG: hypothetical protein WCT85_04580 [Parachlamydiales bacterium]|jgi:hypothetical protein